VRPFFPWDTRESMDSGCRVTGQVPMVTTRERTVERSRDRRHAVPTLRNRREVRRSRLPSPGNIWAPPRRSLSGRSPERFPVIGNLSGVHLIAILAVVLLLFGAPKLPALARSIGQSLRVFKHEINDSEPDQQTSSSSDQRDPGAPTS